jgi:hypothetical protein
MTQTAARESRPDRDDRSKNWESTTENLTFVSVRQRTNLLDSARIEPA